MNDPLHTVRPAEGFPGFGAWKYHLGVTDVNGADEIGVAIAKSHPPAFMLRVIRRHADIDFGDDAPGPVEPVPVEILLRNLPCPVTMTRPISRLRHHKREQLAPHGRNGFPAHLESAMH